MAKAADKSKGLVVTTEHRGVFFGYGEPTDEKTIKLTDARMCVYWSQDVKGVLGLGATGPSSSCRVTPSVPAFTAQGVTGIIEASPKAIEAWEKGPWR